METVEVPALVCGDVNEELLVRNEYLSTENDILRSKISGRIRFTEASLAFCSAGKAETGSL